MTNVRVLDTKSESVNSKAFRTALERYIVGQPEAITGFVDVYEKWLSNIYDHGKPISSILLLGPTGVGKTRLVEVVAQTLTGKRTTSMVKIDCGEFQHSQDIAKLVGSPPGYLGHKETPALLKQATLNEHRSEEHPFTVVLFDEIEKASDAVWQLLLGVLDKGTLTLGDNSSVDFTKTIVVMTSNAGSAEMNFALGNGLGFKTDLAIDDDRIKEIGVEAAKRKFTPEFINRLDRTVGLTALKPDDIRKIITLELAQIQKDIYTQSSSMFKFFLTSAATDALFNRGYDPKYNARNVKREIERSIQIPLARVITTDQVKEREDVWVDYENEDFLFQAVKREF